MWQWFDWRHNLSWHSIPEVHCSLIITPLYLCLRVKRSSHVHVFGLTSRAYQERRWLVAKSIASPRRFHPANTSAAGVWRHSWCPAVLSSLRWSRRWRMITVDLFYRICHQQTPDVQTLLCWYNLTLVVPPSPCATTQQIYWYYEAYKNCINLKIGNWCQEDAINKMEKNVALTYEYCVCLDSPQSTVPLMCSVCDWSGREWRTCGRACLWRHCRRTQLGDAARRRGSRLRACCGSTRAARGTPSCRAASSLPTFLMCIVIIHTRWYYTTPILEERGCKTWLVVLISIFMFKLLVKFTIATHYKNSTAGFSSTLDSFLSATYVSDSIISFLVRKLNFGVEQTSHAGSTVDVTFCK